MKIVYKELAIEKIKHWVNKCDFEVSGFGHVTIDGDTFTVHDAYLVDQVGSDALTTPDPKSTAALMAEHMDKDLLLWWHSHVNMSTFWSEQDRQTIHEFGKDGICVATVFNKKNEYRSAVEYKVNSDIFGEETVLYDEVKTEFEIQDKWTPHRDAWSKELESKVKREEFKPFYIGGNTNKTSNKPGGLLSVRPDEYDSIPQYMKEEAKMIGMSAKGYYDAMMYGTVYQVEQLEKKLDDKCFKLYGMSYDDWSTKQWNERKYDGYY